MSLGHRIANLAIRTKILLSFCVVLIVLGGLGLTALHRSSAMNEKIQGITDNYGKVTFTVPANSDRLEASMAYVNASSTDLAARVRLDLVDPNGKLASYSLPQGDGQAPKP